MRIIYGFQVKWLSGKVRRRHDNGIIQRSCCHEKLWTSKCFEITWNHTWYRLQERILKSGRFYMKSWNPKIIESSLVRVTLVSLVRFQTETYTIGSESLFPKVLDWLQHIWIRVIYENFLEIAITNLVINRFVHCNINHMIWIISKPILVHKIRSKCCQWHGIPSPKECHSSWFGS